MDNFFDLAAAAALLILTAFLLVLLFEPGLPYRLSMPRSPIDSARFVNFLSAIVNARLFYARGVEVLSSGEAIYAAQLEAIRGAKQSVHLEVYLFLRGTIGDQMLEALSERARSGVAVRLVVDRVGSLSTPTRYFDTLKNCGGQVRWYQPIAWYTLKRFNNRTHRDLLIVDGETGFIGGVGVADYWIGAREGGRPWRDTAVRLSGDLVKGLQTSFAENWLESAGEILSENEFLRPGDSEAQSVTSGPGVGMVVNSTPSAGRSTRARMLFRVLLASARESIDITSPYFLPDLSLTNELIGAVKRGVKVTVLMPGKWNNHPIARLASRRRYGTLLYGGIDIHEYQPTMIHAKVLIVDRTWSVVGSTNFDNRSFGLNDEVNVAILDADLAARLRADFVRDLELSRRITFEEWQRRSFTEKSLATLGRLLERQE
ncbi:MAG TPA: phospholipase D-like domain-containing protein [Usitatibacter sp.]|nr:phospholipase D-like domain-containing protein [Usitatibacter sp.]